MYWRKNCRKGSPEASFQWEVAAGVRVVARNEVGAQSEKVQECYTSLAGLEVGKRRYRWA